jgi:hypothetical protein
MTRLTPAPPAPVAAPRPVVSRGGADRNGSPEAAHDFQQALKKKRAAAREDARAKGAVALRDDPQRWRIDDPRRGQAHVCTWKDPGASGAQDEAASGESTHIAEQRREAALRKAPPDERETPLVTAAALSAAMQAVRPPAPSDASQLEPLLWSRMEPHPGAQGQFELLLPGGQQIGVQYAVSNALTQVLLEADSPQLSRQLQACASGIGQRMSERCGHRVDVFAA